MADGTDNFVTYVERAFESFDERPLCALDSLVFSWLSYFRLPDDMDRLAGWEGVDVRELLRAECMDAMTENLWDPRQSRALLFAVAASPRFRGTRVCGYRVRSDEGAEEQFAACTFRLPSGGTYVAFRGTDSTIVGWKEDFNMSFRCPVPSQAEAVSYLAEAAAALDGPLYCGGHSKGGNLAVYAATMAGKDVQERLERAFSHDGPGFNEAFLGQGPYCALAAAGRIQKTLPRSSIIGMIFEAQEDYAVVDSTGFSIFQHNPFSWVVDVDARDFVYCEELSAGARYMDAALAEWVSAVSPEERGRFIDTLFNVLNVTGADRFAEIRDTWQVSVPKMLAALAQTDPDTRKFLTGTLAAFARCAFTPDMPGLPSLGELMGPGAGTDSGETDAIADIGDTGDNAPVA